MHKFKINKEWFESDKPKITGQEILKISGLLPPKDYELLYKVNEGGFEPIQLNEIIDLKEVGKEVFKARPFQEFSIKVDDIEYKVNNCFLSPIEIMGLAGIDPSKFYLNEVRNSGIEVTYREDPEHRIPLSKSQCFVSCEREPIQCIIVNAKEHNWSRSQISFSEIIQLAYGQSCNNPMTIHTVTYKRGIPSKPEGSLVKGESISIINKIIINVTQTNKS